MRAAWGGRCVAMGAVNGVSTETLTPATAQPSEIHVQWEDPPLGAGRWWLARARVSYDGIVRDLFIAQDDMTDSIVGLLRFPPQARYSVLAAVFLEAFESRAAASDALKSDLAMVALRAGAPETGRVRKDLLRWRLMRAGAIGRRNLPFLLLGLVAGVLLGLAVSAFAVSTGFVGWPMVAVGVVLGAATGPLLKLLVDHFRFGAAAGPWGRFAIIMLGAAIGASATAATALFHFWN